VGGENQGGRGVFGFEAVFALVALIERSFHEHSLEQLGLSPSGDGPAI
jgi:hypothetical protein